MFKIFNKLVWFAILMTHYFHEVTATVIQWLKQYDRIKALKNTLNKTDCGKEEKSRFLLAGFIFALTILSLKHVTHFKQY